MLSKQWYYWLVPMSKEFQLDWPYRFGKPEQTALLKAEPADFKVIEDLGSLQVVSVNTYMSRSEKQGENTAWVAKMLAEHTGLHHWLPSAGPD